MDPKFQPKMAKFRRPTILAHIVSALSLGVGFALADRINSAIIDYFYPRENLIDIADTLKKADNLAKKGSPTVDTKVTSQITEIIEDHQVKFKREDFINKVQQKTAQAQDPVDKKTLVLQEIERRHELEEKQRLSMNFVYGLIFAKLGSEINQKFIYRKVPGLIPRLLITTPASVLAYYTFSNFYEGKNVHELAKRLRGDVLALLSFRILIEYPASALLQRQVKGGALTGDVVRSKLARNKTVSTGLWILVLTYLYQYSPLS